MKLYDYFRSTAAYRVRIALNLKQLPYTQLPIHLVKSQQHSDKYLAINPQGLVPSLEDNGIINQSLAILEYLEENYPTPAILPSDIKARAFARSIAQQIACDIHPLNNLRTLQYLTNKLAITEEQKLNWYQHWVKLGFNAIEAFLLKNNSKEFCCGDFPTVADICLIPQIYNANRFNCPMDDYKIINRIYHNCTAIPAFANAMPELQPDCPND